MKFASVTKLSATAAGAAVGFVAGGPVGAAAGAGLGGAIDLWRGRKSKHRPLPEHVKAAIRNAAHAKAVESPAQVQAQAEAAKLAVLPDVQKHAPPITVEHRAPPFLPGLPEKMMPMVRIVDQAAVDYVRKSGFTFEQVYPNGISQLREMAPKLVIVGDSGGYEINVAAINFAASTGLAFKDIYPTVTKLPSVAMLPPPFAAAAGAAMRQAQQRIDAIYALVSRFPRGGLAPYIDKIKKSAPPFVVQTGPQGSQSLRTVNIMAPMYARSLGLPLTLIYPNAHMDALDLKPNLVNHVNRAWGDNQEINPDALLFVATTGFEFSELYSDPPPWNSNWPGSKDVALRYAQLVASRSTGPVASIPFGTTRAAGSTSVTSRATRCIRAARSSGRASTP